jgi:stearoyl-CoA desaturase (delta-9 desaturase)
MNVYVLVTAIIVAFGSTSALAMILRNKISDMGVKSKLSGSMIFSYSLITAGALYGVWYGFMEGYSFGAFMLALFFSLITGLGISLGLHRYDTHKSFKTGPVFLFVLSALAWMGGMKKATWVANHELHHRKEEEPDDPHSPYIFNVHGDWWGFLWSHLGWMLVDRPHLEGLKRTDISKISFIRTERYLFLPCLLLGFAIPTAFLGWEGLWISFLRMFYVLHITFSINSVGHMFGATVSRKSLSRNGTWIGALFTMIGERYHANHHADQRCAFLGWRWFDVDAGKWLLVVLEQFGIVYDVNKPGRNNPPGPYIPSVFPLVAA